MAREWTDDQKAKTCAEILARVTDGQSLRAACRNGDDWTPSEALFRQWCDSDADLASQYARAREDRADVIFEECIEIADRQGADIVTVDGVDTIDHNVIARNKLMIDTRRWMLGKMQPRKYGDKVLHGSDPENPLPEHRTIVATMTPQEAAEAYAATLTTDKG
jgi:hypothetical protein